MLWQPCWPQPQASAVALTTCMHPANTQLVCVPLCTALPHRAHTLHTHAMYMLMWDRISRDS